MADSNDKLSRNSLTSRRPFEPITHTWEIPGAMYEILQKAVERNDDQLIALVRSVITVASIDPHTWQSLPQTITTAAGRGE
jgi:uncharacterized Zn-finger protein